MHVCVIGAGVVGSASAYAMARAGWQVTLLDMQPAPGQGASAANGAQLSYSYVEPLASPAALAELPRWLLSPDSPLRWRPRAEWAHLRWLAQFVLACRWATVQATTDALLALSALSRDTLSDWLAPWTDESRRSLHHHRPGKLVLYRDAAKRGAAERQLAWQAGRGGAQRIVEAAECVTLEPALGATGGGRIEFGVWTESEEVIDARALSAALAQASGATLALSRAVSGFVHTGQRIQAVTLDGGDTVEADQFVLAAGPQSAQLARTLGLRLPIEPIKGYSITLPILDAVAAPTVSITDHARRMVHARLGDHLRCAGFAELCGFGTSPQPARIAALKAAVQATFPGACATDDAAPWAGLRPATPSSLPMVGATPLSNLWLNTGHGGLGLTLAAGSARLLCSLMAGERRLPVDASPYRWR